VNVTPEPITAQAAAKEFCKKPATIRKWAERYAARQYDPRELSIPDVRAKFYDRNDLATIDGCITRGEEIPATPELRDQLRAELRARWSDAA
jgi:hypothetical protein